MKGARLSVPSPASPSEIGHVMIPGMIDGDADRPIEMKPKARRPWTTGG